MAYQKILSVNYDTTLKDGARAAAVKFLKNVFNSDVDNISFDSWTYCGGDLFVTTMWADISLTIGEVDTRFYVEYERDENKVTISMLDKMGTSFITKEDVKG